jgi:hypothetical protein
LLAVFLANWGAMGKSHQREPLSITQKMLFISLRQSLRGLPALLRAGGLGIRGSSKAHWVSVRPLKRGIILTPYFIVPPYIKIYY